MNRYAYSLQIANQSVNRTLPLPPNAGIVAVHHSTTCNMSTSTGSGGWSLQQSLAITTFGVDATENPAVLLKIYNVNNNTFPGPPIAEMIYLPGPILMPTTYLCATASANCALYLEIQIFFVL